jgi:hypothetical protein
VRKLGPAVLAALTLGVVAFFLTRAIRSHQAHDPQPEATGSIAVVGPEPSPVLSASAEPSARPSASVAVIVPPPRSTTPISTAPPPTPAAHRTITLAKVRPFSGVKVAVDGEPAMEASGGKTITLNEKTHTFLFTCIEDLCEPQTRAIGAGDGDEVIEVELRIKRARLTLNADPSKSYVIKEKPTVPLPANVPVDVPMAGKSETLHVRELVSGHELQIELKAGQPAHYTFPDTP